MSGESLEMLAIVVVNYGSSELIEANLAPAARELPHSVVVVVDNQTSTAERSRLSELAQREGWLFEPVEGNIGFGAGMNRGVARAREAGATVLLLVNPDAAIGADSVAVLRERHRQAPLALISPLIARPDGSHWFTGADLYLDEGRLRSPRRRAQYPNARWEPWLSGACLVLGVELWDLVGGFDERYFLYWEDVDLSHRVLAAGGTLEVCSDAVAVHAEGGTQGGTGRAGAPKSELYYFYNIRNRMLFAVDHLSETEVGQWRRLIVPVAWETLMQGGRRQLLRSWRPLLAAARGVRAARRVTATSRHESA